MEVSARRQYGLPMDLKEGKDRLTFLPNLESVLKSKDNTLLIKVHLVKAMVFLVVMYGYERWTRKKAEC